MRDLFDSLGADLLRELGDAASLHAADGEILRSRCEFALQARDRGRAVRGAAGELERVTMDTVVNDEDFHRRGRWVASRRDGVGIERFSSFSSRAFQKICRTSASFLKRAALAS